MTKFYFAEIRSTVDGIEKKDGFYYAQVLKCGEFIYDGQKFTITPEKIARMVANFEKGVKGDKVPLNWRHDDDKDTGWVYTLQATKDGKAAYAAFQVTEPEYKTKVDNGTVCYTSSEIDLDFEDEAGQKHGPVFEGLALTNRPFLRGMEPISVLNFEEVRGHKDAGDVPSNPGGPMDEKEKLALEAKVKELADKLEKAEAEKVALENKSTDSATALKLEEANRKIAELTKTGKETTLRVRLEDVRRRVTRCVRRGQLTAHVGSVTLHNLTNILQGAESTTLKFSEKVSIKKLKFRLEEGCDEDDTKDMEETTEVDRLDMVDSILDTLESLPASVAMEDEDDDDEPGEAKMDRSRGTKSMTRVQFEEAVVSRADELIEKAGEGKLSFDAAVSKARAELKPKVRIVKGREEDEA